MQIHIVTGARFMSALGIGLQMFAPSCPSCGAANFLQPACALSQVCAKDDLHMSTSLDPPQGTVWRRGRCGRLRRVVQQSTLCPDAGGSHSTGGPGSGKGKGYRGEDMK